MNFLESVRIAINAIRVNKMRSILTMLGIIIGIASVIAVFAIGNGGEQAINTEFESFGVDRLVLYHNWEEEIATRDLVTLNDLDTLLKAFDDRILAISPVVDLSMNVSQKTVIQKKQGTSVIVKGVYDTFNKIQKFKLKEGRFLKSMDVNESRHVAVIGEKLADEVFGSKGALGKEIALSFYNQKIVFVVVGIEEAPKASLLSGFNQGHSIYVPYSVLSKLTNRDETIAMAEISAFPEVDKAVLLEDISKFLAKKHGSDPKLYQIYSAESEMSTITRVTGIITGIISAIAAISLLVGGIGVMNIMLVSVTERTREIGIRKALGARRKDILTQFLVEAVIISLIGGVIGTGIGVSIATLAANSLGMPSVVPMNAIVIAWVFSAGVGIFFGIYPANKAAKLDPIEALRYE